MMTDKNICIIGGYDDLSKSFFDDLQRNNVKSLFLNFNKTKPKRKNIFNLEVYELKKILISAQERREDFISNSTN